MAMSQKPWYPSCSIERDGNFAMLGMMFILTHADLKFGTCHSLAVKSWFQVARTL